MQVWIRGMRDYKHKAKLTATAWELPLWSDSARDTGTVTVVGETKDYTGEWAILDGRPYLVKSCAPAKGRTQLTLQLPEAVFARELRYTGSGTETYGAFLAARISAEFVAQADEMYAMPYLTVSNSDTTAFTFPVDSGELYSLLDVIEEAKTAEVYLTWTAAYDCMAVAIAPRPAEEHNLFFDDGHTQLVAQTYTSSIIAKVTVRQLREKNDGVITVLAESTWYWHPDGTVSQTPPTPRLAGEWIHVDVDEETTMEVGAVSAMEGNTTAYKLEFFSDREYHLGDILTCRIGEIVSRAVLTYARRSSKDSRTYYRAGRAVLTLTDILRQQDEQEKKTGARLSGKSSSGHTHDNRYYTESEIKNLLNSFLTVTTISGSVTVNANSVADCTISGSKSGYYPVAVVGWDIQSTGSTSAIMDDLHLTAQSNGSVTCYSRIYNRSGTNRTWPVVYYILWRKVQ